MSHASGTLGDMLIVMAGLPASGKSTIAAAAGRILGCSVVSVDPIEAALWTAGIERTQPTGLAAYVAAEAVAEAQLRLGGTVIIDAVNDAPAARQQWADLAARTGVGLLFVEVITTDRTEHRRRLETRERGIPDFPEPTWDAVQARRASFDDWHGPRLRLDSDLPVAVNARAIADAAGVTNRGCGFDRLSDPRTPATQARSATANLYA